MPAPRENPWAKPIEKTMESLLGGIFSGIEEGREKKYQNEDMGFLAKQQAEGNIDLRNISPDQAMKLAPQMKSKQYREAAMKRGLQGMQQEQTTIWGKDAQGNYQKKATLPPGGQIEKPDPMELEAQKEKGRREHYEKIEAGKDKRQAEQFRQQNAIEGFRFDRQLSTQRHQLDMQETRFRQERSLAELKQAGADKNKMQEAGRKTKLEYEKMRQKIESDAAKQKQGLSYMDDATHKEVTTQVDADKAARLGELHETFTPILKEYGIDSIREEIRSGDQGAAMPTPEQARQELIKRGVIK